MPAETQSLAEVLARHTREGHLYEKLENGRVRCFACGHRCLIPPGRDGICRVRFNENGVLKVPFGYVAALQLDPVEKKPFFHALPGSKALSFGMLGCDYHCGYCFTGETVVVGEDGPVTFEELFDSCERHKTRADAAFAFPHDRRVVTASGGLRRARGVVRHEYRGELVRLRAGGFPEVRCTPDHRIYATTGPDRAPTLVHAKDLGRDHYLIVPRQPAAPEALRPTLATVLASAVERRGLVESANHYLVPLRAVESESFEGLVYNMEVEGEHSYLAGFFGVANCQNWVTSQALRDEAAVAPAEVTAPHEIVSAAKRAGARIVTSTYNEPLITSEWAVEVFKAAKAEGLVCSYVSNGNGTEEVLEYIRPWVSLYKVDLKGFRDRPYRDLGGTLERVLATIRSLHDKGFWVEIVTLVVPGFNDSPEELRDVARFLVSVSPDIPWHVTAFHPDYKMDDRPSTSVQSLLRAAETGAAEGLNFVYAGNLPGAVRSFENTYCPGCRTLLVERLGYRILKNRMSARARCPDCQRAIPGVWTI
jgi:pyruvate formate lyase activating enzyme